MDLRATLFVLVVLCFVECQAQLLSYTLQERFTVEELDSVLETTGFSLPIPPSYDIEVYQVIYETPYKHIDSLVSASGIVIVPKEVPCALPLGCYAHGTFARWNEVPSYDGPERTIGLFFAGIGGVLTAMPDELGLGDYDSSVTIHPYISGFHLGHTSIYMMRAARQLADDLGHALSGEVFLAGYSEGGYTTMATHRLIQEQYSGEFNLIASAPMSGPYDLKETMVDVMLSDDPYSVPSYFPYILLGYHSVYPALQQLYPNGGLDIFKSPYDTLLPPLYYSRQYSLGDIDPLCPPVPKDMLKDTVLNAFINDSLHPLRLLLAENSLMDWAPQTPVKIYYCTGDEQVTYLNAVRAHAAWQANGAPSVEIEDGGDKNHGECVQPSLTGAALFLLSKRIPCVSGVAESQAINFSIYPNPATGMINVQLPEGKFLFSVFDVSGKLCLQRPIHGVSNSIDLNFLRPGCYIAELKNDEGEAFRQKLIISK